MAAAVVTSKDHGAAASVNKSKRVARPDKAAFEADLKKLDADLKVKEKIVQEARKNVGSLSANSPKNEGREKLRKELDQLKQKQAQFKNSRNKITDEIKQIDERLKRKLKELQASKSKVSFKSAEDLDNHVKDLERRVDAGTFRIAEERKALNEISNLKKLRKNFTGFNDLQVSIDDDKAKISVLKASIDDTESKTVSARYNEVIALLDAIREESQEAYKNRNELYELRNEAQKAFDEAYQKIKARKDEYYGQMRTHQEQSRAEYAARQEREEAERQEAEKEKRRLVAEEKLEIASEPAFFTQIATAKMLLAHFDPTYKAEEGVSAAVDSLNAPANVRTVAAPVATKLMKKEPLEFYSGSAGKKYKKKGGAKEASVKKEDSKLTMNFQIVEDLTTLNIAVPGSPTELPKTIEELKKKLEFYNTNQDRVTKERIDRAKAEIAKLEAAETVEAEKAEAVEMPEESKESEE